MPGPPGSQSILADTSQVASATGTATYIFPVSAQRETWTGTLSCPTAPLAAQFSSFIGAQGNPGQGTPWGSWGGNSIFGPIQATTGQTVSVTATGLTPGVSFDLVWRGWTESADSAQLIYPEPNNSALLAASFPPGIIFGPLPIIAGTGGGGSGNLINLPSSTRTLLFLIQVANTATPVTLIQVGIQTGATLTPTLYAQPPYLPGFPDGTGTFTVFTVVVPVPPLLPLLTNQLSFSVAVTGAGALSATVFADSAQYDESVFYNGVTNFFSHSLAAAGSATLATGPLRMQSLFLESAGGATASVTVTGGAFALRTDSVVNLDGPLVTMNFPENAILKQGQVLTLNQVGAGLAAASLAAAYP